MGPKTMQNEPKIEGKIRLNGMWLPSFLKFSSSFRLFRPYTEKRHPRPCILMWILTILEISSNSCHKWCPWSPAIKKFSMPRSSTTRLHWNLLDTWRTCSTLLTDQTIRGECQKQEAGVYYGLILHIMLKYPQRPKVPELDRKTFSCWISYP